MITSTTLLRQTLLGVLFILLNACAQEPNPAPLPGPKQVAVMQLTAPERIEARSFPGHVRAAERVNLSFNVPGKIIELHATEGTQVEKGALLARLDARDYESKLKAALAEYQKADANYQRAEKLVKGKFISKAEYDQLKAARDVAAARVTKARKAVADTELRAPFSGVVAKRYVENFTEVQADQEVLSLQDVENLEIVVDVAEQFVVQRQGRPQVSLVVRFETLPGKEFPLAIKEYATEADPATGTYQYVATLKPPEGANILPGMTATVIAQRTDSAATHFVLPIPAVFADVTPEPMVWVVGEGERVQMRQVKLGRLVGKAGIEIVEGLKAGEVVVIEAATRLREGMQIVPRKHSTTREETADAS